ncbi:MAG: isoprenyl transferase [Candidatus Omnitrophica bacterium]|nr:isoprenyl transferase [Candidatus Omnitrophota bacterium]
MKTERPLSDEERPRHIAIIMDGNGRWAKERGLTRTQGHRQGVERVREVIEHAQSLGVEILTVFAFSTENWTRPRREIAMLFSYMTRFLLKSKKDIMRKNIRLTFIGRRDRLDEVRRRQIREIEELTENNNSFFVNIALDYGGRWDICEAVKKMLNDTGSDELARDGVSEERFQRYVSLAQFPDPDLLIRTSGEQRISNFLLWQLAYSELYFTQCYWPDFDKNELMKAFKAYAHRERRFGRVNS